VNIKEKMDDLVKWLGFKKNDIEKQVKSDMPNLGKPIEVEATETLKPEELKMNPGNFHVVLYGSPETSEKNMRAFYEKIPSSQKIITRFIKFETETFISKLIREGYFIFIYYSGHGTIISANSRYNSPIIEAFHDGKWASTHYLNELLGYDKVNIVCEACSGTVAPRRITEIEFSYALFTSHIRNNEGTTALTNSEAELLSLIPQILKKDASNQRTDKAWKSIIYSGRAGNPSKFWETVSSFIIPDVRKQ